MRNLITKLRNPSIVYMRLVSSALSVMVVAVALFEGSHWS